MRAERCNDVGVGGGDVGVFPGVHVGGVVAGVVVELLGEVVVPVGGEPADARARARRRVLRYSSRTKTLAGGGLRKKKKTPVSKVWRLAVPGEPERVAPVFGAQGVAHKVKVGAVHVVAAEARGVERGAAAGRVLVESDAFELGARRVEELGEVLAVDARRWRQSRERDQRREDVDQFGDGGCSRGRRAQAARGLDHERDVNDEVKVGLLLPLAVLAQVVAVVRVEDDDGLLVRRALAEQRDDVAHVLVHVRDGRVVPARARHASPPPKFDMRTRV